VALHCCNDTTINNVVAITITITTLTVNVVVIEALDGVEADISVLCSQGNTPQLVNATHLQTK